MKLSFQARTLVLLTGLVLLIQLVNLWVVLNTLSADIRRQVAEELDEGTLRVNQLLRERSGLMHRSTELLAADYSFRTTIAGADPTTVQAALESKVRQIGANLMVVVSIDGTLISDRGRTVVGASIFQTLAEVAEREGMASDAAIISGRAYEFVSVPVRLQDTVGWLVVGFLLDDEMAVRFAEQVGMDVGFISSEGLIRLFGSTIDYAARMDFPTRPGQIRQASEGGYASMTLAGESLYYRAVPVSPGVQGVSVLLSQPVDAALAGYRSVRNRLLGYMVISLVVALALAFWFSRSVTRPVELLSRMASRIREGDYQDRKETSPVIDRQDEFGELLRTFQQMQEGIAKRESAITYFAYHDELTGLANRRRVQDQLLGIIEIARLKRRDTAVILIGVNRYRQIVDTLGHRAGESLIKTLGTRLPELCHEADLVARVSTDEFLALVSRCTADRAEQLATGWMRALEQPVVLAQASVVPELSAGVVLVPRTANTVDSAMRRASIALSDSRDAQVAVCHYEKGRDESYMRKLAILADLKRAVEQDELVVHYQPKVELASGCVESVEALVRWIHPEHGFLPPDEFIGLAESSGNIGLLTSWMLETVIRQLACWQQQGVMLKAAVNLSALDLQDERLLERICRLLDTHGVASSRLILEVTESAMMKDTQRALQTLAAMREQGLTVSIDDFGTGYSSMSQLKDLPVDELKIDRAFVSGIEPGGTKAMIMKAIIGLGHGLGLRVVCEGVETQEEWNLLTALGSDVVQGYLISRPLPVTDFDQWWQEHHDQGDSEAA